MSNSDTPASFDPMKLWRDWFVKNERDWSEAMTRMIKDDTVSQGLGTEFNASLVQQQAMKRNMADFMANMNLPTRDDLTAMGERIGQLEDAVARIEALLVRLGPAAAATPSPKPSRTRKPASKTQPAHRHDAE